ncbi:hypothetical protein pipiens_004841 [Culex pipiens pipiens]|uniref:Uncharacterized protein n=1 Tax=Culex pipiens pipiens TaxID=38569 RepID=A0ABD1CE97_CULPP
MSASVKFSIRITIQYQGGKTLVPPKSSEDVATELLTSGQRVDFDLMKYKKAAAPSDRVAQGCPNLRKLYKRSIPGLAYVCLCVEGPIIGRLLIYDGNLARACVTALDGMPAWARIMVPTYWLFVRPIRSHTEDNGEN